MTQPEPEALFRIYWDAGYQPVGAPHRPGRGQVLFVMTPLQMARLAQVLSRDAIIAMGWIFEECFDPTPNQRLEVPGWGSRWLRERGMRKSTAERAAAELRDKGYIMAVQANGTHFGKQLGIVPSTVYAVEGEPIEEKPRAYRGQTTTVKPADSVSLSGFPGNQEAPVDEPLSGFPGKRESETEKPQVTALSGPSGKRDPEHSSSSVVEELFYFNKGEPGFDIVKYLTQPTLTSALVAQRDVVLATLASAINVHVDRAEALAVFLGHGATGNPAFEVATAVVKALTPDSDTGWERHGAELEQTLRARNVNFPSTGRRELCAYFALAVLAGISVKKVNSWPAWLASLIRDRTVYDGPLIDSTGALFDDVMRGRAPKVAAVPGEPVRRTEDDYTPEYLAALRKAAEGTVWLDDDMWPKLMNNLDRQSKLLNAAAARDAEDDAATAT